MLLGRFFRDRKGGVAPMLALGIIPLVGAVGAAIDYSRANEVRTAMQAALDATALVLAKEQINGEQSSTSADSYFRANFAHPEAENVSVAASGSSANGSTSVTLTATASVRTTFAAVLGYSTIPLTVHSDVIASADGLGCVLSLDPTANGATTGQGSASVVLDACSLYDNSNDSTALTVGGSARISAYSVGVVGGISGSENIVSQQGVRTGIGPVVDPYANDSFPAVGGCTETNYRPPNNAGPQTISPGVYCGGISLNAGDNVTLNPGIYYLDGGDLTVNGGATLTGDGVTLVFTKKNSSGWANATINGNATIRLTPPQSGPTAGIVMFADRNMPAGTTFKFNGGAAQYLGGAVYIPTGAVSFAGGVATGTSCTQIIGGTVTFTGNSSLAINCSSYNTKPFSQTVLRISK